LAVDTTTADVADFNPPSAVSDASSQVFAIGSQRCIRPKRPCPAHSNSAAPRLTHANQDL